MPKLTLSVDKETVEQAKRLAKESGTSVSAMFSQLVRAIAGAHGQKSRLGPLTRRALGLASLPKGKSYREILEEALLEKYGIEE